MAISQDFNPFANLAVHVPKAYHEDVNHYSSTFGSKSPEDAPFKRYVDFWLLAAAVGASEEQFMTVDSSERHEFITGVVFQRDLATIEFLFLLAIAHSGDPFVAREPRQVLDIAEGYAAAGIPLVKEMMETGHLPALQNLTRSLVKSLADDSGATDG
ncbi:MAG: hypothetical protein F4129_08235 [Acidimicrobiia bacterium]|nr:hypothetical protein [bacterium]MXZ84065.1 hypothetical protein [Acidimicrobiia bacterium]MYG72324.1 hypothetical protein [Acidimicrobiia bacterium]MYH96482.1 hypothetical protein [Acidimicrobiia bacterium]MYL09192.1 hypothetical protein [Acidimicrobiia bacterium]